MNQFFIGASPHIRDNMNIQKIMFIVIITLIPAGAWSIYIFGIKALWVILTAIASAVGTEWCFQKCMKRPVTIRDGSAILTGLLLAYNLPPGVPLWIPAIGSFVAIFIGKQIFGGLGHNPMNPALIGRAFLMASWRSHMMTFRPKDIVIKGLTLSGIDSITDATPLNIFRKTLTDNLPTDLSKTLVISELNRAYSNLFFGKIGGCIGEVSACLILLGAAYLLYRRIIGWKIPVAYLGTVAVLITIFKGPNPGHILFHLFSGGLFLGAFYMATDMVTSPVTFKGRIWFGVGCGILTVVIRLWGGYPEGVSYAILLMNLTTPLLDRYTRPRVFGG